MTNYSVLAQERNTSRLYRAFKINCVNHEITTKSPSTSNIKRTKRQRDGECLDGQIG